MSDGELPPQPDGPPSFDERGPVAFIEQATWIFAKTMPKNPHEYCLRKKEPLDWFQWFVVHIRENGYRHKFGRSWYTQLDVQSAHGLHTYWTMGWPVNQTELINRKKLGDP